MFWKLDTNLDNMVDENDFRASWEEAVAAVCPAKLSAEMRADLGYDQISPELMSVKKKTVFFARESERASESKSGLFYVADNA